MIFSNDKAPVEAGLFWRLFMNNPSIVEVVKANRSHLSPLVYYVPGVSGVQPFHPDILWGDKIEIPTVESPTYPGKGEE